MYWVTTATGNRIGPFDDWGCAWWSGVEHFGYEGWVITSESW